MTTGTTAFGPGARIAGKYVLKERLGKGGAGTVWRALHEDLGRDVAIKLLNAEVLSSEDGERRFLQEVENSTRIVHHYAVQVRDFGRDRALGCLYCTMDLIVGRSLRKVLTEEGRLVPARAVRLGAQVLEVLAEAHQRGLIHRDLKPENLMLTVDPATGEEEVRVLDFGIAKAISTAQAHGPQLTRAGTTVGTLAYMSPEQAQGLALAPSSDLYTLGVVLFELLSGKKPSEPPPGAADTQQALLCQILMQPPRQLAEVAPDVPPALAAVVMGTLEKDPARRPQDARAVREALLGALSGSGAPARVETTSSFAATGAHRAAAPAMDGTSGALTSSFAATGTRPVAPAPAPAATSSYATTGAQPTAAAAVNLTFPHAVATSPPPPTPVAPPPATPVPSPPAPPPVPPAEPGVWAPRERVTLEPAPAQKGWSLLLPCCGVLLLGTLALGAGFVALPGVRAAFLEGYQGYRDVDTRALSFPPGELGFTPGMPLEAGKKYEVTLLDLAGAPAEPPPHVELCAMAGAEMGFDDRVVGVVERGGLTWVCDATGTYYVRVFVLTLAAEPPPQGKGDPSPAQVAQTAPPAVRCTVRVRELLR